MRLYKLLIVFFLLQSAVASAQQLPSPNWPLRKLFGKDVAVLQLSREAVAEICIGETCTRFVINDKNGIEFIHDFAFLYMWMVESYDLAPRKDANGERFVDIVLKRRKGNCTGDDEAVGRCALARMYAERQVVGIETVFENGWRKTRAFDLKERLQKAGILPK